MEIKRGKELKIIGATRPTVHTYVPGTPIDRDACTDSTQSLLINQYPYFNIEIEDIDQAQSQEGMMDAYTSEGAKGLNLAVETYIASLTASHANASASYTIAKSTIVEEIEKGMINLYKNNCLPTDTFYLEVSPKFYGYLRPAMTELFTQNSEMIKNGVIGKYGNALVSICNTLYNDNTDDYCILRTSKAIAYAGQIESTEAFRPEDAFSDAVKALLVFGAKIVRPEQMYIIKAH